MYTYQKFDAMCPVLLHLSYPMEQHFVNTVPEIWMMNIFNGLMSQISRVCVNLHP